MLQPTRSNVMMFCTSDRRARALAVWPWEIRGKRPKCRGVHVPRSFARKRAVGGCGRACSLYHHHHQPHRHMRGQPHQMDRSRCARRRIRLAHPQARATATCRCGAARTGSYVSRQAAVRFASSACAGAWNELSLIVETSSSDQPLELACVAR